MTYEFTNKDLQDANLAIEGTPALELELNEWGNGTLKPVFDGAYSQEEMLKQLLQGARNLRRAGFAVEVFYQYLKRAEGRYIPFPHGKVARRLFSPVEETVAMPNWEQWNVALDEAALRRKEAQDA